MGFTRPFDVAVDGERLSLGLTVVLFGRNQAAAIVVDRFPAGVVAFLVVLSHCGGNALRSVVYVQPVFQVGYVGHQDCFVREAALELLECGLALLGPLKPDIGVGQLPQRGRDVGVGRAV